MWARVCGKSQDGEYVCAEAKMDHELISVKLEEEEEKKKK